MTYRVGLTTEAEDEFDALPSVVQPRVAQALRGLADDPRPHGCKKLVDMPGWRIRVGDYRILYIVNDKDQVVTVYRIRPRSSAYRRH